MSADQLTTDLLDAGLTWSQLYAIQQKMSSACTLAEVVKQQSDYASDVWDDMVALLTELRDAADMLLTAMQAELAARKAREAEPVPQPKGIPADVLTPVVRTNARLLASAPAGAAQPSDLPDGTDLSGLAVNHVSCTIGRRGGYVNPTTGAVVWSRLLEDQPGGAR